MLSSFQSIQFKKKIFSDFSCSIGVHCNFCFKAAKENVIMVDESCTSALALVVIALCLNCQLVFIFLMK